MAEVIYEDFEKIYSMFDEYFNDIKRIEERNKIHLTH